MDDALTYADMYRVLAEPVSQPPAPDWKVGCLPDRAGAADRRCLAKATSSTSATGSSASSNLPGHSPDSIGLLDERDGLFFSGDAIYDDTLIDDLPDSDRTAYRATMARIIELPVRIAYGGHGESFSGERMREIARRYIEASEA